VERYGYSAGAYRELEHRTIGRKLCQEIDSRHDGGRIVRTARLVVARRDILTEETHVLSHNPSMAAESRLTRRAVG
jgi:hypothetical protein